MKTSLIIAEFDPPRNIIAGLLPRRVSGPVDQLDFQRAVDRFGEGVIVADPCPSDGLPYPKFFQRSGELGGSASPARVEYRSFRKVEVPSAHLDLLDYQWRLVILVHLPSAYFPRRPVL